MPQLTLAKLIYKENSIHFNDIESTRNLIRYYCGTNGDISRKVKGNKTFHRPLTYNTTPFKIPKSEQKELKVFTLPKDRKSVLFLSDIHLPYHNEEALILALNYGLENDVDTIWLNGDIMDMYQASSHEKNPSHKNIQYEFDVCKAFLKELKDKFPKANIYYKEGNHETRWQRLLMRKAPELLGINEFSIPILLGLNDIGIHWIENETLTKFGKLNVLHGNEFKGGGGVNPARALYLRAKANCIAGDKHKSGENTEGDLDHSITTTWAVGCLCYSEDTEILTQDGFKYFKDVLDSDKIGIYDKKNNLIRLSNPLARQVFDYNGEMIYFSDKKIDLLVTPEHKMIYKNHSDKIRVSTSSKLNSSKAIYNYFSAAKFQSLESFDKDLSILCAWIITEGTIDYSKNKYPRISIYQKKELPLIKLEKLVNRLGFNFKKSIDKRNGVFRYRFNNQSSLEIINKIWDGNFEKRIPRKILNSNYDNLIAFYETIIITDGHRRKDSGKHGTDYIPTKDLELANDYAELATKLGYTYYIKNEIRNTNFKTNATIYLVRIRKSQVTRCRNISSKKYIGKVYDFTSETGWLVVRRNGKVTISSNCELNPAYLPMAHTSWNHGFAHILMDGDYFHVINKRIHKGRIL